jgi:hypothetical protein
MLLRKTPLSYDQCARSVNMLTQEEQLRLMELISANLRKNLKKRKKHSIMELEGLGAEIWKGMDAQEYVRRERESWD